MATILSLVCCYALLVISLLSVWRIEDGTLSPAAIFENNLSGKIEMQMAKKRASETHRSRCDSDGDKKDLLSYLAVKVENYDKFAEFLV